MLTLPGDAGEGSPNRRMHWRTQATLKAKWKLLALSAWNEAGCPVFTTRVRLSFHAYRGREMDESNIASSLCLIAIENGLKGSAFPDDSPRYVQRGPVTQTTAAAYRRYPHMVVQIETLDEDPLAVGA
jgi:hypothetical protein